MPTIHPIHSPSLSRSVSHPLCIERQSASDLQHGIAFVNQPNAEPECNADLNNDGVLDFYDVSAYIQLFTFGCP